MDVVYVLNDNLIEIDKLQDASDDSYINDATVTVTLKDSDGTNVTGQSWPLTLGYVAGTDGKYQGTLESALNLTSREQYYAHIDAVKGTLAAHWEKQLKALTRT
jgi:hypothetical protein